MGNSPISTEETTIYYPSDWLIDGGPPYESMGCPNEWFTEESNMESLTISYEPSDAKWRVSNDLAVVMESTNIKDITQYVKEYMEAYQRFVDEQP